jgi:hypothetical protein
MQHLLFKILEVVPQVGNHHLEMQQIMLVQMELL